MNAPQSGTDDCESNDEQKRHRRERQATPQPTSDSLSADVLSGAKWTTAARLIAQVIQFGSGVVLARLLDPAAFGSIAAIYVFATFAALFVDAGFASALVHKNNPTEKDKSTVFWVSVIGGLLLAFGLAATAPAIAAFYRNPELTWLAPVVGLSFALSFGTVHMALMEIEFKFKTLAAIEVGAAVLGYTVAILAALAGVGPLALALGVVTVALVTSTAAVASYPWLPRQFVSVANLRELWAFSRGLLGSRVIDYWGRNIDNIAIGRTMSNASLGFYNRGYNLMLLPVSQVTGALGRVMFPALVKVRDDRARLGNAWLKAVVALSSVTVPSLVGLAVISPAFVPLLWGPQWGPVVPLLQILCVAGIPQCITNTTHWLFQAQGRTGVLFKLVALETLVMIVAVLVALQWGLTGVAGAVLFRYWAMLPVNIIVAGQKVDVSLLRVVQATLPIMCSSALMASVVFCLPILAGIDRESAILVPIQTIIGIATYILALRIISPPTWRLVVALRRRAR